MSLVLVIAGFAALIVGIALYTRNFKKYFLNQALNFSLEHIKKNYLKLLIPILILSVGMGLISGGYYLNGYIIEELDKLNISYSAVNIVFVILFVLLFGLALGVFATCLLLRMYVFDNKDKKLKKYIMIFQYSNVLATILFLILALEFGSNYLLYPLANHICLSDKGLVLYSTTSERGRDFLLSTSWHFDIAIYALCIIGGALIVLLIVDQKCYKEFGHHNLLTTIFFVAFPSGIVGARLWYCVGNWTVDGFDKDPSKIFRIWEGGLAIMGGAIFGIVMGVAVLIALKFKNARYKPIDCLKLVDIVVPTILIAQAIGRFGNFFNNEVHGGIVSETNFLWIPTFIRNNMHYSSVHYGALADGEIYLPLFFIEGLVNIAGYFLIEYGIMNCFFKNRKTNINHHAEGSCVGWYIAWYGATRAILEPLRDGSFNMGNEGTFSNISSYFMIGGGLLIVLIFAILKILNEKGKFKYQWQKYNELENDDVEVK